MKHTLSNKFRRRTIKITELEYVLLGFTSMQPFSGYDIKKIFDKSYIIRWSASPGSIYPALKRLTKKGFLESKKLMDGKIPKDLYEITDEGKSFLENWLIKPFVGNDIVRYGLELKISFLHNLSNKKRQKFLEKQIQEIEKCIDDLPRWKKTLNIKSIYRDKLYEEKLREFKNYISMLEDLM